MLKKITISFLFMFFIFVLFSQNRKLRKDYDLIKNNQFEEAYTNLSDIRNKAMYTPFSYFLFSEYFGNINNKKYNIDSCFWYLKKSYTLSKSYVDKKELEDACEDIKFCILKLNNKLDSIADFAYQKKYSTTNNLNDLNYFISFYTETKSNIKAKERLDMLLYNNAKSKKSIQSLEKFIQDYPQSQFLDSSKLEIEKLEYNDVIIKNDVVSFDQFLKKYPNSTFKTEINKKKQKKIFDTYLLINKENEFNIYIEKYPNSDFIAEAKKKRDLLVYEESLLKNTIDGYSSVLTKYPDIEYAEKIRYNIKKLETISTEEYIKNNEVIETESGLSLVVTGQGQTLLEAKQNAIRSAIEQAYGAFISTKTEIFNDKIVSDEMTSISSGNIKSFEIISESQQLDSIYAVILKVIVSVDKLTSFVQSKGYSVEVKGSLFALNIKQQILNEEAEIKTINSLVNLLHEPMQQAFDYKIKSSSPKSLDENNKEWTIPLEISIFSNKNIVSCNKLLLNTLLSISLSKNDVNDYEKLNKANYPILLLHDNIIDTIFLRKLESVALLHDYTNKWLFYLRNFKILSNIGDVDDRYFNCIINYIVKEKEKKFDDYGNFIKQDEIFEFTEYPHKNNYKLEDENFNCSLDLYQFQPYELIDFGLGCCSDHQKESISNLFHPEYEKKNPNEYKFSHKKIILTPENQLIAVSKINLGASLEQIEKLSNIDIKSKGIISKISHGGYVVYEENGHGLVVSTKEIGNLPWEEAKKTCNNLVLNGYNDWYLPTIEELDTIYNYFKEFNELKFYNKKYQSSTEQCFKDYETGSTKCWYKLVLDFSDGSRSQSYSDNGFPNRFIAVRKF